MLKNSKNSYQNRELWKLWISEALKIGKQFLLIFTTALVLPTFVSCSVANWLSRISRTPKMQQKLQNGSQNTGMFLQSWKLWILGALKTLGTALAFANFCLLLSGSFHLKDLKDSKNATNSSKMPQRTGIFSRAFKTFGSILTTLE